MGPIGDEVGQHVSTRLELGTQAPSIRERLFVATSFYPVSAEMRYACDFCLCPSRVEPFGYVDIEFAWHGTMTVGTLGGGLGKVPGIYYRVQETGDSAHLLNQLRSAISAAIAMSPEKRAAASQAGLHVSFPFDEWSQALDDHYRRAHTAAAAAAARRAEQGCCCCIPPSREGTRHAASTRGTRGAAVAVRGAAVRTREGEGGEDEAEARLVTPGAPPSESMGYADRHENARLAPSAAATAAATAAEAVFGASDSKDVGMRALKHHSWDLPDSEKALAGGEELATKLRPEELGQDVDPDELRMQVGALGDHRSTP